MRLSLSANLALVCVLSVLSPNAFGQNNGGGNNGGARGPQAAGIEIDAAGRARIVKFDNRALAERIAAQKAGTGTCSSEQTSEGVVEPFGVGGSGEVA